MEAIERRLGALEERLANYPQPSSYEQNNRERIVILETHRAADLALMEKVSAQMDANQVALAKIELNVATLAAGMSGRIGTAAWSYVAGAAVLMGMIVTLLKLTGTI